MRDHTDSRTLPLSLGKPRRQRNQQSGAAFLPPLKPCELQQLEFQRERIARRERELFLSAFELPFVEAARGEIDA